ncbi:LOW QUALITY PROTEIN: hypothetical protein NC651_011663 [Populus alba x Populus x berolinensis]|nr:LOW QUALITY PROTEIN: hypothetical protein NC651_011663 [Populus alba x Populus x berolinensis]
MKKVTKRNSRLAVNSLAAQGIYGEARKTLDPHNLLAINASSYRRISLCVEGQFALKRDTVHGDHQVLSKVKLRVEQFEELKFGDWNQFELLITSSQFWGVLFCE